MPDFTPFPSIARLTRECTVTEKIDGTNAQVVVFQKGQILEGDLALMALQPEIFVPIGTEFFVAAGSRSRWISRTDDNFGFARWVYEHREELVNLGPGSHFGEWWGAGVQRTYGLTEKRFSLFNVGRWAEESSRPKCCSVVPTLYVGLFDTKEIDHVLWNLAAGGSIAVPGFMKPEGIVIFHKPSSQLFKKTLDKNDGHKGA